MKPELYKAFKESALTEALTRDPQNLSETFSKAEVFSNLATASLTLDNSESFKESDLLDKLNRSFEGLTLSGNLVCDWAHWLKLYLDLWWGTGAGVTVGFGAHESYAMDNKRMKGYVHIWNAIRAGLGPERAQTQTNVRNRQEQSTAHDMENRWDDRWYLVRYRLKNNESFRS